MNKVFLTLNFLLLVIAAKAQAPFTVSVSEAYPTQGDNMSQVRYEPNYYFRDNKMYSFNAISELECQKFQLSPEVKMIEQKSLKMDQQFVDIIDVMGTDYMIYWAENKKAGKAILSAQEFDFENMQLKGTAILIAEVENQLIGNWYHAFESVGLNYTSFIVTATPDRKQIAFTYLLKTSKEATTGVYGTIFCDENFQKTASSEITIEQQNRGVEFKNVEMDHEGNVYVLLRDYYESFLKAEPFHLLIYPENGAKVQNQQIKTVHGDVIEANIDINQKGNVVCALICMTEPVVDKITHSLQQINSFGKVTNEVNYKEAGKLSYNYLQIRDIYSNPDGSTLTMFENFGPDHNGHFQLYAVRVSKAGEYEWTTELPKFYGHYRVSGTWGNIHGQTYSSFRINGIQLVFYMDDPGNSDPKTKKYSIQNWGNFGNLMCYFLDEETGEISRAKVFDAAEITDTKTSEKAKARYIYPVNIQQITETEYALEVWAKSKMRLIKFKLNQ